MAVSPCSYDFFTFFIQCEATRVRRNLDYLFIHFVKGPKNSFRDDKIRTNVQNVTFFENVILPGLTLLNSCTKFEWVERQDLINLPSNMEYVFPRGYDPKNPIGDYVGNDLALNRIRGDSFSSFTAPIFAKKFAKQWISRFNGKKIVTLTTRELDRDDVNKTRVADVEKWEGFFEKLKLLGVEPIVVRDTDKAFSGDQIFKNATECPEASISVTFRLALYELSEMNFFKNNGPLMLANFSNARSATFQDFDNNVCALSENWFRTNFGMKKHCAFPMTTKKMKFVWEKEDEHLMHQLYSTREQQNESELNVFFDVEHLALTCAAAIRKFIANLTRSNLLAEDLVFLRRLEQIKREYPNIIQPNIIDLLTEHKIQMHDQELIEKVNQFYRIERHMEASTV
jgi:hypothetical protein